MKLIVSVIALGALATLGISPVQAQEPLKIGVLVPITGAIAVDGNTMKRGNELAAEQINQLGGIKSLNGAKVVLDIADTQSKPDVARSEADRLVAQGGLSALLGAGASGLTQPAMQIADRNKIPFVIPNAVADTLTEQGLKFVFRVASKSKWYAEDVVSFVEYLKANNVKTDRIALVYEDGVYGQSVSKIYKTLLPERGFTIVEEVSFRSGLADMTTQVAKLKASEATIVLTAAFAADTAVLLRAMAARDYKPYTIGIGAGHINPSLLQIGAVAEKTFGAVDWSVGSLQPAAVEFEKAYQAKYGEAPNSGSAESYVATWAVALAAEQAKSRDPAAIRDALASLHITSGPAAILPQAVIEFGPDGQNNLRNVIVEIIDGKFVPVWPEKFGARKFVPAN